MEAEMTVRSESGNHGNHATPQYQHSCSTTDTLHHCCVHEYTHSLTSTSESEYYIIYLACIYIDQNSFKTVVLIDANTQ